MKVFKITNKESNSYYISKTIDFLVADIENSEVGDVWKIEVTEMTEEEYEALPEFDGF